MANDTWQSNTTGDWEQNGDWSEGNYPGALDAAELGSGADVTVGSSDYVSAASLTLDSNASLDIQGELDIGSSHINGLSSFIDSSQGTLTIDGGALIADQYVTSATGDVNITNGGTYLWESTGTSTQNIDLGNTANDTFLFTQQFGGTISDFNSGDTIAYSGTVNSVSINASSHSVTFDASNGTNYTIQFASSVDMSQISANGNSLSTTATAVCFASGTMIRTVRGDVAVELLCVGDLVITASGQQRPVVWLGQRHMTRSELVGSKQNQPIRVQAGAFGKNLPYKDLWLSPAHAVCVNVLNEVFIPVGLLENGTTITQVEVDQLTYWHVELESHDVLVANGLPAESYLECDNRDWFYGGQGTVDPMQTAGNWAQYCRPVIAEGVVLQAVRSQLRSRVETVGWTRTADMDIHLVVDGVRVDPVLEGGKASFVVPAFSLDVQLVSKTFVPAHWADCDFRELGLRVHGFHLSNALGESRDVSADDESFKEGFYNIEHENGVCCRWTNGRLPIPEELWADCETDFTLIVSYNPNASRRWVSPHADQLPVTRPAFGNPAVLAQAKVNLRIVA